MLGGSGAYDSSPEKKLKIWCGLVRFGAFGCIFRRDCVFTNFLKINEHIFI